MTAVDSNVLVRLLTGDDHDQFTTAKSLFETESIWIAKTVLLETDWVLRSLYEFDADAVRDSLHKLLGLLNVYAEDESSVAAALALNSQGLDLADALHVSSRGPGTTFVSFDRAFVRRASRAGVDRISALQSR